MNILLIEDDGFKRDKLREYLAELIAGARIAEARSAQSAFRQLRRLEPDLVVLDMSLPTFDIGPSESGGRPQVFGGVEVLREMDRRNIAKPVVVVTQYETFGDERMSLGELASKLAGEHAQTFVALVYYETASEQWKKQFEDAVSSAVSKTNRTQ